MNHAHPIVVYATRAEAKTLDQDVHGGNPFASALIEQVLGKPSSLGPFLSALRRRTLDQTQGYQRPEWQPPRGIPSWHWSLADGDRAETRVALVLVVSDYRHAGWEPLSGAALDERRIASLLAQQGFDVVQGIGPGRRDLMHALAAFRRRSERADASVIYCTGHGLHCSGETFLIPGDYPVVRGFSIRGLRKSAISIPQISAFGRARRLNLTFFAGCRSCPPEASTSR